MGLFEHAVDISFGDCDPASLVFYPNYFRWMDATFHAFLKREAGGHDRVCKALGARGVGLMQSHLDFRAPASDGERLIYRIESIAWAARSLTIAYTANTADHRILDGWEQRGVFVMDGPRMKAADVSRLREALERSDVEFC